MCLPPLHSALRKLDGKLYVNRPLSEAFPNYNLYWESLEGLLRQKENVNQEGLGSGKQNTKKERSRLGLNHRERKENSRDALGEPPEQ